MLEQPAVFIDRDGVINKETGYVHTKDEFHFIDGIFDACREMNKAGYRIIIVTNQAGIARGYYTEDDFRSLTEWMLKQFSENGIEITDVYYCPHHPVSGLGEYLRDCCCRKPAPGMILRAAREHSLDLEHSILVGDKVTDIESGRAAGVGCCALVVTGHPVSVADCNKADYVFADLPALADAVADNRMLADCIR